MNAYESWFERGHVAIVTGASKGLGLALARLLVRRGISVIITARGAGELAAAEAELGGEIAAAPELTGSTRVEALAGDIADLEHVHRLVGRARDVFGRLDLVVNNASSIGSSPMPTLDRLTPDTFSQVMRTNVFAPLHLIQHASVVDGDARNDRQRLQRRRRERISRLGGVRGK